MNEVTPADADQFEAYVQKWQRLLNLDDWRISRSLKRPKGVMAQVSKMNLEQRLAVYQIGLNFGAEPVTPHALESTAVHELLHIMLCELIETSKTADPQHDTLRSVEHRIINTLERLLVPENKNG